MATWNEFCSDVSRISKKAAKKTGELAHSASLHIKLENYKSKLSSSYEKLGRLTYKQLKTSVSQAEEISEVIATIDSIRADVSAIEKVNTLLSSFRDDIIGRMGIPHRNGVNIISVAMESTKETINSLSGKLGMINGVTSKVLLAK